MSIEYCHDHSQHWDSDYLEDCPDCLEPDEDEDMQPEAEDAYPPDECSLCGSDEFFFLGMMGVFHVWRCRACLADHHSGLH